MGTVKTVIDDINGLNSVYQRFINLLSIDAKGCWLFRTQAKNGYSTFGINKKTPVKAHRFSYKMHKGEIPEGLHIDHLCSVKNCCNPDHLEAVTPKENTRRAWERGEAKAHPKEVCLRAGRIGNAAAVAKKLAMTHCKKGHPYSEENTYRPKKGGRDCRACSKLRYHRRKSWQQ
jgi:hypothetical protein